ncbi:epididymal sperm-binding protein 1-like [Hemicordylus capensis]|uniref:epididymal sperm-binding protein 1-like n=1 Tax=Hemicordylus capensis TaxID=884348 RepID=UPI002303874F|nr:epididymal sperm-binding protein 1-like [Hemicordylus capensis]
MASPIAFLVCTYGLLPLLAASQGLSCKFPFIFEGKWYFSCTTDGTMDGQLWCATTSNYDKDGLWRKCEVHDYGGNSHGKQCVFPFSYLYGTYYTCTNYRENDGRYWCATTGSYDKDRLWTYCADTRLNENPTGPCIFPFVFKGKKYSSCIADGMNNGKLWCSLTKNYDSDPKWAYCDPSDPRPCEFPFNYRHRYYYSCTTDETSDEQLWCATTSDYDKDTKWKVCASQEYGGNSEGKACAFPFIYKNETYDNCTNEDEPNGNFWCATTKNYDEDMRWSFCADTRRSIQEKFADLNMPCSLPFIYNGNSYLQCTANGTDGNKLWCSLTHNYDVNKMWRYCEPSDRKIKCTCRQSLLVVPGIFGALHGFTRRIARTTKAVIKTVEAYTHQQNFQCTKPDRPTF